ncbi:MAG: SDR family oxidoreductase [Chloroflexota bacterium]|nr:SDR family oxidoreductase [Chloroflexota bacterium]
MGIGGTHSPVAIVTGASRRGAIGAAICRRLAADGVAICFTHWAAYDRAMAWGADDDGPAALEHELAATGVQVVAIEADLAQPDSYLTVLDLAASRLGPPSILVNNATYSTNDDYSTLDAATLDAHYAVNVRGMALLSAEFARRWPGGPGGRIINLTSGQSLGPMPDELAYVATKGAVEAFTVSLSAGVAARGITVNAVNPGPTDSGWITPDLAAALLPKFPRGRLGHPDDVARLVAFLASPDAGWITGQVIHSEGGFLRS